MCSFCVEQDNQLRSTEKGVWLGFCRSRCSSIFNVKFNTFFEECSCLPREVFTNDWHVIQMVTIIVFEYPCTVSMLIFSMKAFCFHSLQLRITKQFPSQSSKYFINVFSSSSSLQYSTKYAIYSKLELYMETKLCFQFHRKTPRKTISSVKRSFKLQL